MFLTAHSKRNGSLFLLLQEDDGNLVVIDEVAANVINLLILYAIFNFIRFVSIGYVYEYLLEAQHLRLLAAQGYLSLTILIILYHEFDLLVLLIHPTKL